MKKDLRALLCVLFVLPVGCLGRPSYREWQTLSSPDGALVATEYTISGWAGGRDDYRITVRKQGEKERTVFEGPIINSAEDPVMRWNSDRGLVIYSLAEKKPPRTEVFDIDGISLTIIHSSVPR
jgi:hypothetical protein